MKRKCKTKKDARCKGLNKKLFPANHKPSKDGYDIVEARLMRHYWDTKYGSGK